MSFHQTHDFCFLLQHLVVTSTNVHAVVDLSLTCRLCCLLQQTSSACSVEKSFM